MPRALAIAAKDVLQDYKDIYAWSYPDIKHIRVHLAEHKIELELDIRLSHQTRFGMNPNYAKSLKEDIHWILEVGFLTSVEEAS